MRKITKDNFHKICIVFLTGILLAGIFLCDGAIVCVDTQGYVNMDISREPGYSVFLKGFSLLFGTEYYYYAVVAFQLFLLGVAIVSFVFKVTELYGLSKFSMFVLWGIQVGFLGLYRFGSGLQAIFASTISTEGLTYSFFLLYFTGILQLNKKYTAAKYVEVIIYCMLMTLIRTQLAVSFVAPLALWFLKLVSKQFCIKKYLCMVAVTFMGLVLALAGQKLYTLALYDVGTGTVGSGSFFMTAGLYGADAEDVDLFQDEEERYIFEELYTQLEERQTNYKYVPESGFMRHASFYSQNFDVIKFEIVNSWLHQYFREKGMDDGIQISIAVDELNSRMGKTLLKDNLSIKLGVFGEECTQGLMRTIAKSNSVFLIYALIAYIFYIICIGLCFRKKCNMVAWGAVFVLLYIVGNTLITSFMIFCEPRYVLYNMVPFYVMGYIMVAQLVIQERNKRKNESCIMLNNLE